MKMREKGKKTHREREELLLLTSATRLNEISVTQWQEGKKSAVILAKKTVLNKTS